VWDGDVREVRLRDGDGGPGRPRAVDWVRTEYGADGRATVALADPQPRLPLPFGARWEHGRVVGGPASDLPLAFPAAARFARALDGGGPAALYRESQEGLDFVPVLVGIFAIPEIIDLAVRGTSIAGERPAENLRSGVMEGIKDTFRHFWLVFRCSMVGVFVGILPGAGGGVAQWMAYAHAVQSAKDSKEREGFGKGDVRGVLGPGAANNSKEGGELIPTVAFGVPGGGAMAILLSAFLIMGLSPGPDMLTKHLAITFSMVWTLAIANVITVLLCLTVLDQIAKVTNIRGNLIIPFILLLVFIGSYTANGQIIDLIVTLIFGVLSYFMVLFGWPRPPFVLGFVLGKVMETYLFISVARYGFAWLGQPLIVGLILLMLFVISYPYIQLRRQRAQSQVNA